MPHREAEPSTTSERHNDAASHASSGGQQPAPDRMQTIANVLTILVALCAIGLSVWEGCENRRFNRLSVLPKLEPIEADYGSASPIESEYFFLPSEMDSLYAVSYALENSGLGPAVLQRLVVFEEDTLVFDSEASDSGAYVQTIRRDLARLPFQTGLLRNSHTAGEMLEAGKVHHFLTVIIPFAGVNRDSLDQSPPDIVQAEVLERRSFVFCYCSVYNEDCDMVYLGAPPPAANVCRF